MNNKAPPINPIGGGDGVRLLPPKVVEGSNMAPPENRVGPPLRPQVPQGVRPSDNGRVDMNIVESYGHLILPLLPQGHNFW